MSAVSGVSGYNANPYQWLVLAGQTNQSGSTASRAAQSASASSGTTASTSGADSFEDQL